MSCNWDLKAGAGKAAIAYPETLFPLPDGPQPLPFTGVHDIPHVRAVILEADLRFVLISAEVVIFPEVLVEKTKQMLHEITGARQDHIWIIATHTITAPHIWDDSWLKTDEDRRKAACMKQNLLLAIKAAAKNAMENLQEASLSYGQGICGANVSRMIHIRDGWWNGSGEDGVIDHTVPVIRINDKVGRMMAVLYNYCAELSIMEGAVMADGGRHITADLSGAASAFVEREYEDQVVALFLPGISTDQGPAYKAKRTVRGRGGSYRTVNIQEKGFLLVELLGERLGEQVLCTAEQMEGSLPVSRIQVKYGSYWFPGQKQTDLLAIRPTKDWIYVEEEPRTASVELVVLGDLALISGNHICVSTALKVKEASPFPYTIVVSCVTGAAPPLKTDGRKYMAEKELYDRITFQARNSSFGRGSAELMYEDMLSLLEEAYRERSLEVVP